MTEVPAVQAQPGQPAPDIHPASPTARLPMATTSRKDRVGEIRASQRASHPARGGSPESPARDFSLLMSSRYRTME